MTDQGIVTTVTSSAEGITLGGVLSIGRVVTVAETAAHGQTGTSAATFTFTIADVHGPGIDCGTCTASDVADAINRVFAGRIEARVPSVLSLASPHGFTGLVTKDPLLQDSDRALNDDDSIAVDGLDLVVVNDYQAQRIDVDPATGAPQSSDVSARSRLLLEFAGVQSESHYGIFPLPQDVAPGSGPGLAGLLGGATGGGRAGAAVLPGSNLPLSAANVAPRTASPSGGPTFLNPVAAFWDAVRLVITRPGEAAVLACLWTLFAAPLYLTLRRRNLAQALAYGTGTRS
jgi:hypothetical protein